jgi:hypothetical protein
VGYVLSLLSLLFAFTAQAAVLPSGVPNATLAGIGGTVGPQVPATQLGTTWFGLDCSEINPTTSRFFACYKNGSQYQVTSGKTLSCPIVTFSNTGTSQNFQFVSDTAAFDNAAALTSGTYQTGSSAAYAYASSATATVEKNDTNLSFQWTSERYVGVQLQNGAANSWFIHMACTEN